MNWLKRSILTGAVTLLVLPTVVLMGQAVSLIKDPLALYKEEAASLYGLVLPHGTDVKEGDETFDSGEDLTESASSEVLPDEASSVSGTEAGRQDQDNNPVEKPSQGEKPEDSSKPAESSKAGESAMPAESSGSEESAKPAESSKAAEASDSAEASDAGQTSASQSSHTAKKTFSSSLDDMLFIGDSRTVGLRDYGELKEADFFASTGMTVYKIESTTQKVQDLGSVTLPQLLKKKQYGKIFIMLGINELGYDMDKTTRKFESFISDVRKAQPEAVIFLGANLHVTKNKSKHEYINNKNINELNSRLKAFADGDSIYYLDANVIFDDSEGNLDPSKTSDEAHVLGRYYKDWGTWIREEIRKLSEQT